MQSCGLFAAILLQSTLLLLNLWNTEFSTPVSLTSRCWTGFSPINMEMAKNEIYDI